MAGEIIIRVANDGSTATLSVPRDADESALTRENLLAMARQSGILIDGDVEGAIGSFLESIPSGEERCEVVIARAMPPEPGDDGRIEWAEGFDPTQMPEREFGEQADYYKGYEYVRVSAGEVIGLMHEPTLGRDGRDVRGGVIRAKPGRKARIRLHKTLTVDGEGRIVADSDGVLLLRAGELMVSRELRLPGSVDFSTGHVDFRGTVWVRGGVCTGFRVNAEDDIRVEGLIEVAELTSGGDLIARCGMAGKGRGRLSIGRDARATYFEEVRGIIGGDLRVQSSIVGCELIVCGGVESPSAVIIGGHTTVTGALRVRALGSEACTPTTIVLGDVPVLRPSRKEATRIAEECERELATLAAEEQVIRARSEPRPGDRERLSVISASAARAREELDAQRERLRQLERAFREKRMLDVQVERVVHAGVRFEIDDRVFKLDGPVRGPLAVFWDAHGEPMCRAGVAAAQPLAEVASVASSQRAA